LRFFTLAAFNYTDFWTITLDCGMIGFARQLEAKMASNPIVYALVDMREETRGTIFYVGMGGRDRPLRHLRSAHSEAGHPNFRVNEVMAAHLSVGIEPEIVILAECDGYPDAIRIEREYIKHFGRRDIDPGGILTNILAGWEDRPERWMPALEVRGAAATAQNERLWKDVEHRAKRVLAMRGKKKAKTARALEARLANLALAHTPEARVLMSEGLRVRWSDPAYRKRLGAKKSAAWEDPEKRAAMLAGRSAGIASSWSNPDVRARRIAGIKAAAAAKAAGREPAEPKPPSPGRSATMRAVNGAKTSEQRSAEQASAWSDPEVRAKRVAGLKAAAQNPELRAARLAAMAAGKQRAAARKAAEKAASDAQSVAADGVHQPIEV
jgi:hypothetical protein